MSHLSESTPSRRVALVLLTCAIAAVLFHRQVATALISRGDDFLTRGDTAAALRYYERAITVDSQSEEAVDRYVFFSTSSLNRASLRRAIEMASRFLAAHPTDTHVLADRALCYERLGQHSRAAQDFSVAARSGRSARDYTFAGWATLRSGRVDAARDFWLDALRLDPQYGPARHALQKIVRR